MLKVGIERIPVKEEKLVLDASKRIAIEYQENTKKI